MFKFYQKILLHQPKRLNRVNTLTRLNGFASATIAEAKNMGRHEEKQPISDPGGVRKEHKMIKNVFAAIKLEENIEHIETPNTDSKLNNAKSVDELLSISDGNGVSRRHALTVVSILSNWTSTERVKLSDFEKDPRFLRLCKVLLRGSPALKPSKSMTREIKSDDLSTVLSVTADEEAAKLIESITLSQMVRVLTTLSLKRRRSTLLLRTLAFNISRSSEQMDIKQCADLFYSVASLNFYDENLFEKTANNVITLLQTKTIEKSAVVGSILTSVGLLKYKHPALLDTISEWILKNQAICRPQDIFSFFMTIGVLDYVPINSDHLFKVLVPQLTEEEAGKPLIWLDIVWSLLLLKQVKPEHVQTVLNDQFISKLRDHKSLNTSAILKLLNIDGASHYLLPGYKGPQISKDHDIRKTTLMPSREKSIIINSLVDTLKNLIPETYFRIRVNTGLGFYIDAECLLDKSCNPLPLNDTSSEKLKVAILAYDYHDMCKGHLDLTGVNVLNQRFLSAMGYRIVSIPYTEFKSTDKVVNRVQYLESKLKEVVKE